MKAKPVQQITAFQSPDGSVFTNYEEASRWALELALYSAGDHDEEIQERSKAFVELIAKNKAKLMPFIKAVQ